MPRYSKSRDVRQRIHGFTLIETLITIVIIGLLSAIAVPSLMGQITKAKETEAKIALDFLRKNQYSFYLENHSFTKNLQELNFSAADSKNYEYFIEALEDYSPLSGRLHLAFSKRKGMRSYGSVIYLKNGQLEECGLLADDISAEHASLEKLRFIFNAIQHYEQYCS
ncbi:type IV pilin protein [Leptolyngbya ectocarpi]|nr:type IV pilin-like G/H family protein [Leptolyngbya ectocarpi]